MLQDSASPGITFDPPISISTSRSAICSLTSKLVLESVSAELSASGLASEQTVSVSARTPPLATSATAAAATPQNLRMAHLAELLLQDSGSGVRHLSIRERRDPQRGPIGACAARMRRWNKPRITT